VCFDTVLRPTLCFLKQRNRPSHRTTPHSARASGRGAKKCRNPAVQPCFAGHNLRVFRIRRPGADGGWREPRYIYFRATPISRWTDLPGGRQAHRRSCAKSPRAPVGRRASPPALSSTCIPLAAAVCISFAIVRPLWASRLPESCHKDDNYRRACFLAYLTGQFRPWTTVSQPLNREVPQGFFPSPFYHYLNCYNSPHEAKQSESSAVHRAERSWLPS
jgi:hypothetical protein